MSKGLYAGLMISSIVGFTAAVGCRSTPSTLSQHSMARASTEVRPHPNILPPSQDEVVTASAREPFTESEGDGPRTVSASQESVVDEAMVQQSIDLTTALMMTSGKNPQVAYARARIEEAMAQVDRANALKLPSIRAGVNYNKHEGRIQDVAGTVIETSRGSFYSGLGANAVGAGSPTVPGIVTQFHFADMIFQPKIAQRTACARQAGARATVNDQLLATAIAYTELLRAEQELSVAIEVRERAEQLEKITAEFEKAGEGLASDHDRARTELALSRNVQSRAEEASAVASARLAELIRWENDQRLVPEETHLVPVEMVACFDAPRELVAIALTNRPELAECRHLVGEAVEKLKRERNAPLVPSVLLAASYGGLGGGLGSSLSNYGDRLDADAVAYWEVRQLGLGEKAIQRESRSRISQARIRESATLDRIAREVIESQAQVRARRKQIEFSEQAIQAANDSFEKNWDRIRNGQGLPIEALQAMQSLALAQREYIRSVSDYNIAQFTLQRCLGWPAADQALNQ